MDATGQASPSSGSSSGSFSAIIISPSSNTKPFNSVPHRQAHIHTCVMETGDQGKHIFGLSAVQLAVRMYRKGTATPVQQSSESGGKRVLSARRHEAWFLATRNIHSTRAASKQSPLMWDYKQNKTQTVLCSIDLWTLDFWALPIPVLDCNIRKVVLQLLTPVVHLAVTVMEVPSPLCIQRVRILPN